jgi:hypothetical protein
LYFFSFSIDHSFFRDNFFHCSCHQKCTFFHCLSILNSNFSEQSLASKTHYFHLIQVKKILSHYKSYQFAPISYFSVFFILPLCNAMNLLIVQQKSSLREYEVTTSSQSMVQQRIVPPTSSQEASLIGSYM